LFQFTKDEIKELKKSTVSKILQGNSLMGLDVIAFDSNYNRLDTSDTTTMLLFEELKKNSEFKINAMQPHILSHQNSLPSHLRDETKDLVNTSKM
jgi:hypothetical protein